MAGVTCEVCARGAIFASRCRLGNEGKNPLNGFNDFWGQEMRTVEPIFGRALILTIEYLFELGNYSTNCPFEFEDVANRWIKIQKKANSSDRQRMTLLMKNIIRNKGKLVLYNKTID